MKKIFAFTLMLLVLSASFFAGSVTATTDTLATVSRELETVLANSTDDEIIGICVVVSTPAPEGSMMFWEYGDMMGLDTVRLGTDEAYYNEHHTAYMEFIKPVAEEHDRLLTEAYKELFGEDTSNLRGFRETYMHFFAYATRSQIIEVLKSDLVLHIDYDHPFEVTDTSDLNQICMQAYIDTYCDSVPDVFDCYCVAYGEVGDKIVFRCAVKYFPKPSSDDEMVNKVLFTGLLREDYDDGFYCDNRSCLFVLYSDGTVKGLRESAGNGEIDIYEVAKIVPGTYLCGDANYDNELNIKDATCVQKYVAKIYYETVTETPPYDVWYNDDFWLDYNLDSEVNIKDATAIQKCVAKIV